MKPFKPPLLGARPFTNDQTPKVSDSTPENDFAGPIPNIATRTPSSVKPTISRTFIPPRKPLVTVRQPFQQTQSVNVGIEGAFAVLWYVATWVVV